jgi:cytochrome c2
VEPGAGSELGPNLAGVFGRAAPVDAAYGYSDAFKAAAARGLVWDDATLDRFLRTPAEMIPGVRMPLSVADATQRRDLVAYLATLAP